jgi:Ppx/GppA phosphatase family
MADYISVTHDHTAVEDNIMNIVAIDSGSGSIKFGVAHINTVTHEITDFHTTSLAIQLAKDLENHTLMQEIQESGLIHHLYNVNNKPLNMCGLFNPDLDQGSEILNLLSPVSSKAAHDFLESNYANKFSEIIKDLYISKIASVVQAAAKLDPKHPTEVWLVGTAALRKADDGHYLIDALAHKLHDELHVNTNFKIISQQDEGIYAFEGGVGGLKLDADKVISWDIGGGSIQITGKEGNDYQVLGGTVASSTFQAMVMNQLIKDGIKTSSSSVYPLDSENVDRMIDLGISKLTFAHDKEVWFANKKAEEGVEIVGVGNIHISLLTAMKDNLNYSKEATSYTKEDLTKLIKVFTNKSVEEVKKLIPVKSHPFLENHFINMMLVAATMEKYHIDTVRVADVSNVNTLLYKASSSRK